MARHLVGVYLFRVAIPSGDEVVTGDIRDRWPVSGRLGLIRALAVMVRASRGPYLRRGQVGLLRHRP